MSNAIILSVILAMLNSCKIQKIVEIKSKLIGTFPKFLQRRFLLKHFW